MSDPLPPMNMSRDHPQRLSPDELLTPERSVFSNQNVFRHQLNAIKPSLADVETRCQAVIGSDHKELINALLLRGRVHQAQGNFQLAVKGRQLLSHSHKSA